MQTTVAVGEELLKLTGNFLMFAYVVRMAVRVIRDAVNPRSPA
jgi:hypothetical protein